MNIYLIERHSEEREFKKREEGVHLFEDTTNRRFLRLADRIHVLISILVVHRSIFERLESGINRFRARRCIA